jgi:hypothetical protein
MLQQLPLQIPKFTIKMKIKLMLLILVLWQSIGAQTAQTDSIRARLRISI